MADSKILERLETKIDDQNDHLSAIDATLARQEVSLSAHIKRTEILEETVEPIKEHLIQLKGVIKFIKFIATIAGIIEVIRLFK